MSISLNQRFGELDESSILITGASGWLGRELLCVLSKSCPDFKGLKLTLTSNSTRHISLHGKQLTLIPLSEVDSRSRFDLIIHLAFATQDKMSQYGARDYISINSALTDKIVRLSEQNPKAKKLIFSSGVASQYQMIAEDSSMHIYGKLKKDLESNFDSAESLVLRLWNTSGHHLFLDQKSKYAIGEFISCAKKNIPIQVNKNLLRTYVAASSLLEASLSYLLDGGNGIVNSGGDLISLQELALLVTEVLNSSSHVSLIESGKFPHLDYVSPRSEIPIQFWGEMRDLRDQIKVTANCA